MTCKNCEPRGFARIISFFAMVKVEWRMIYGPEFKMRGIRGVWQKWKEIKRRKNGE